MQLSQEVEFWLRIGSILVPSVVALVVPFITYRWITRRMADYQVDLSKEIEDYKKDISRELENQKFQLQSGFQIELYEFQTRYSSLHQKTAEVIEKLFGLLVKVQNDLQTWANWGAIPSKETIEEFYAKTREHLLELGDYYDEKRIYFDAEIQNSVLQMIGTADNLLLTHDRIESMSRSFPEIAERLKNGARNIIDQNIHPVMNKLESKFKTLLAAQTPSSKIEKK